MKSDLKVAAGIPVPMDTGDDLDSTAAILENKKRPLIDPSVEPDAKKRIQADEGQMNIDNRKRKDGHSGRSPSET